MRTRKLLISLVVYFLLIGYFVHSQENTPRTKNKFDYTLFSKRPDKTIDGKYKSLDFNENQRGKQSFRVDDRYLSSPTDQQDSANDDYVYRNNRAIDVPGYLNFFHTQFIIELSKSNKFINFCLMTTLTNFFKLEANRCILLDVQFLILFSIFTPKKT